ncbi:ABC transporter ATP-binding protein [Streptomyces sp. NPDC055109]
MYWLHILVEVPEIMLALTNVSVLRGAGSAVHALSLEVAAGEVVGLVGANGAGKSTALSAIAGLIPISSGQITFMGKSITGMPTDRIARKGIACVPENRHIFGTLTVKENLILGRTSIPRRDRTKEDLENVLAIFPTLRTTFNRPARFLSGGEQQQLAIARALMAAPQLLILDEPSLGLAPLIIGQLFHVIDMLKEQGFSVLLIEQSITRTIDLADRTYIMRSGTIVLSGSRAEMQRSSRDVKSAVFGF